MKLSSSEPKDFFFPSACIRNIFNIESIGYFQNLVWLAIALAFSPTVLGQSIPVKNAGFDFEVSIHGIAGAPDAWKAEGIGNKDNPHCRVWNAPGSSAVAINDGASLSQTVELPPLAENLLKESKWQLGLAVDILGIPANQKSEGLLKLRIKDAASNKLLAEKKLNVSRHAPVSKVTRPKVWASSFQPGSNPENAFDGNPDTIWHSKWGDKTHPHWLAVDFGEVRKLKGFTYTPRYDRGNGTVKNFQLETSNDGITWKRTAKGEFQYPGEKKSQEIKLPKPVECRSIRLRCDSKRGGPGDHNASCAEFALSLVGEPFTLASDSEAEPAAPCQREFILLNSVKYSNSTKLQIEVQAEGKPWVVLDQVHLFYVPQAATAKMAGKANGVSGPDIVGAGSYGFTGLMIHQYPALPVISVAKKSPADKAGMEPGDLLVGIDDQFLPNGNVEPGFEWLNHSHEALLGRAAIDAYDSKLTETPGRVKLNVLRSGKLLDLKLKLNLPKEVGSPDFLTNPKFLNQLNDELIHHVLKHQKPDGEWPGGSIHTALGGLALLSTGDPKHAEPIKRAANWICQKHGEPNTGFYWHPSFAGIFLCEYFLATGDGRVLPVIERNLKQMSSAFHTSKWGTETFGHGPTGLPYGNKSLVAVMVHCLVFESLADRCGIESNIKETLDAYLESAWSNPADGGHGALGYNASYKDLDEYWSRTGLMILALKLDNRRPDMRTPMTEIMRKRHPWFRNSHAYGEPGGALGLIGLSQENSSYFNEVLSEYRWWFGLALEPGYGLHFTMPHMGAPYMEGPVLINNAYGIVTNIHKKSLHITGQTNRNWLKVDKIPVPLSEVMILQDRSGQVNLRCKIPGSEIRYTIDGSEPSKNSAAYAKPFSVEAGTIVKAIAVSREGKSKVTERSFARNKSKWSVVSASGNADPVKAIARAGHCIDGDSIISWVTDTGEGAAKFPHHVVIDLGESQTIERASLRFTLKDAAAKKIVITGGMDADSTTTGLGELMQSEFKNEVTIPFSNRQEVRFLKIEFSDPFEDSPLLMLGELDLF